MCNVIHQETAFKIGCVIKKSSGFQRSVFARRELTGYYGRKIRVIAEEDLIVSKLRRAEDGRPEKQLSGVKNLMRNGFDADYIEGWAKRPGADDLLEECRREIGQ